MGEFILYKHKILPYQVCIICIQISVNDKVIDAVLIYALLPLRSTSLPLNVTLDPKLRFTVTRRWPSGPEKPITSGTR